MDNIGGLLGLVVVIIMLAAMWMIYSKANKPGWACLIPIYNIYVLLQVVGRPGWWLLMWFIPGINLIAAIIVYIDLAKSFGKDASFGCLMLILPFIFIPLLAFGDAKYKGPVAA